MKKLIVLVLAGLFVTGLAIAVGNDQKAADKSAIAAAKKSRASLKEVADAADEAHEAAKKAHKEVTKLKETVQKEKAKGHGDPATISALEQAERYATDLISKMSALMKDTFKSLSHAKEAHTKAKEEHRALKEKAPLVELKACSL